MRFVKPVFKIKQKNIKREPCFETPVWYKDLSALRNERAAIGACDFGGILLVCYHADRLKRAVILSSAVILAFGYGTFNGGICLFAAIATEILIVHTTPFPIDRTKPMII